MRRRRAVCLTGTVSEKASCEPFSIETAVVTLDGVEMTAGTKFMQGDVVTIT